MKPRYTSARIETLIGPRAGELLTSDNLKSDDDVARELLTSDNPKSAARGEGIIPVENNSSANVPVENISSLEPPPAPPPEPDQEAVGTGHRFPNVRKPDPPVRTPQIPPAPAANLSTMDKLKVPEPPLHGDELIAFLRRTAAEERERLARWRRSHDVAQ